MEIWGILAWSLFVSFVFILAGLQWPLDGPLRSVYWAHIGIDIGLNVIDVHRDETFSSGQSCYRSDLRNELRVYPDLLSFHFYLDPSIQYHNHEQTFRT